MTGKLLASLLLIMALAAGAQPPMTGPGGFGGPPRKLPALPPGAKAYRDLAYVEKGHALQKLDLYLPRQGSSLPLIVLIHGGAFMMGSKEDEDASMFLREGYAVASLNYRLSRHALFPAQVEDCKAAVRWLRAHAGRYGLAPDRFGAMGRSAGGYLVTMLGVTGGVKRFDVGANLQASSRVQAVADYFGPTDFLQMDAHRLPGGASHNAADSPESRLIGGPIQENRPRVARANPIPYVTRAASPFFIAHGDKDLLVPHHQSELLAAALKKAGVTVSFYTVKGAGHGFEDAGANRRTLAFFRRYLRPKL